MLGFRRYRTVPKPWATKVHHALRLAFARMLKRWTIQQWMRVLWIDKAMFTVSGNTKVYMYQRQGSNPLEPRYTEQTSKHPECLMVWGSLFIFWCNYSFLKSSVVVQLSYQIFCRPLYEIVHIIKIPLIPMPP